MIVLAVAEVYRPIEKGEKLLTEKKRKRKKIIKKACFLFFNALKKLPASKFNGQGGPDES